MRTQNLKFALLPLLLAASVLYAQTDQNSLGINVPAFDSQITPYIIPCKNMIDDGLYKSIKRRTDLAIKNGAKYIIYDIDTYGGSLFAAFDISNYFLHDVNPKVKTVAYISKKAISAGAMISVACNDIIMKDKTTIGDCAPIQMGGKLEGVEREKVETVTRAAFVNSAEANHYPEALLKAMVTIQLEVYRVKNLKTGQFQFFEKDLIPKDSNEFDLENKLLVVKDDQLLTLTASEALEYGVSRATVENINQALSFLAKRDSVTFSVTPRTIQTNWSEELVRWINSPAVMGILVMIAMLGVYMELSTPGLGLPGLTALICVVIIIGSKYLTGMANWIEIAMFITGLLLLSVEVFILPGFGIAGMLGIFCLIAGLFGMLIKNPPEKLPWPETQLDWQLFTNGAIGLSIGFTGFIILAIIITKYMPKLQFLSGLILTPTVPEPKKTARPNVSAPPDAKQQNLNIGDLGTVVSTLRPTGKVRFDDSIVDCVAQAEFLERETKVEISQIHGNRVVVKKTTEGDQ